MTMETFDFLLNRHGRLVFPFRVSDGADRGASRPNERASAVRVNTSGEVATSDLTVERIQEHGYATRYDLLSDLARSLLRDGPWATSHHGRCPTRWRDVPRTRGEVFLPNLTPWTGREARIAEVEAAYRSLLPRADDGVEARVFSILFAVLRHQLHQPCVTRRPLTIDEFVTDSDLRTLVLEAHDPDFPVFSDEELRDCAADDPELEALLRWAMLVHNAHPWPREFGRLKRADELGDDDFVVLLRPRDDTRRDEQHSTRTPVVKRRISEAVPRSSDHAPVPVGDRYSIRPKLLALAVAKGEHVCTNEDIVRNACITWTPMTAADIAARTGIEERRYTARPLDELALDAAARALAAVDCEPGEFGGVVVCSATNTRPMPSLAAWLGGELGITAGRISVDLVAACAGFVYGLAECIRLLQEVDRPLLLVCADKFSDKMGTVRSSRMIFGDGAAALVLAPAPPGVASDVELVQTYAGGTRDEVNSVVWPDPAFDGCITVRADGARSIVRRYLCRMADELRAMRDPADPNRTLLDGVDLVVPHQANRTMIEALAAEVGIPGERLYFDIDRVGNTAAASIPIAMHDAVLDGVVDRPTRLFTPAFGAGATAGYAVLRLDPSIVIPERQDKVDAQLVALNGSQAR